MTEDESRNEGMKVRERQRERGGKEKIIKQIDKVAEKQRLQEKSRERSVLQR